MLAQPGFLQQVGHRHALADAAPGEGFDFLQVPRAYFLLEQKSEDRGNEPGGFLFGSVGAVPEMQFRARELLREALQQCRDRQGSSARSTSR